MIDLTLAEEGTLARLTIRAQAEYLPTIAGLVRSLAGKETLDARSVERFTFAVEEASANIMAHAYPPDKPGLLQVSVLRRPGKLAIALTDQGLPFDFQAVEGATTSRLARLLRQVFEGEIHWLSLGRGGN